MKRQILWMALLTLCFTIIPAWADETNSREILLQPVHKDTPFIKRPKNQELGLNYPIKMLKIKDNPLVKAPPAVNAAVLFYGEVNLGYPPKTYGILIDFEGAEKALWPDQNGDRDYASETMYPLFKSDRYTGGNIYFSPTPLTFQVDYLFNGECYSVPIQMELPYLIIFRAGFGDFLNLQTRTWFIGTFEGPKGEQQVAIVDANDNGIYNDPEDMIFIDKNFDLAFSTEEGKKLKSFRSLPMQDGNYSVNFGMCPMKLILKKG